LQKIFPEYKPNGFASPAWVHPEDLNKVLNDLGFRYCADSRSTGRNEFLPVLNLKFPPTTLVGEPGGIALLENLVAKGVNQHSAGQTIVEMFRTRSKPIAYDHPYFAGVEGLPILAEVVTKLLEEGYVFQTVSKMTND
jgi:hypothetical protein